MRALVTLTRAGRVADPRARDALDHLESVRTADGHWHAAGRWRRRPGSAGSNVEAIDWGPQADEMLTVQALTVRRAAADS